LQTVLDQMGIKAAQMECQMLINAVDKDLKGAVTFDEFADMIYGSDVEIGGQMFQSQERHVRHVTKSLVDMLVHRGPALGKAFCEIDPERRYEINKVQFANALSTASNHISKQAIDFLWAAQFPGESNPTAVDMCEDRTVDWRAFMSQLAKFANEHRVPTPCCIQGRKRQYDLLQRSAALTGGELTELDLNRPDQDAEDEVAVVADQLVHKSRKLADLPRDTAFLTPHYVEFIRTKAGRTEGALKNRIPEWRLRQLLKSRKAVTQDELIDLIDNELVYPTQVPALNASQPLYKIKEEKYSEADVLTLEPEQAAFVPQEGPDHDAQIAALNFGPSVSTPRAGILKESIPAYLKLSRGDVEAYVSTMRMNKADEVDVEQFLFEVYRPACEKSSVEEVNDGLNRQLRLNPPPRERPPDSEEPRYANYWQARYMMELINDSLMQVEVSNGGKLKASKAFKRLDSDGDGHLTLSDLEKACSRYKIPYTNADLHAVFTALDKEDVGSIDIGEFTRNFEVHQGSWLDNMQKPVYGAIHEGGVMIGGPLIERQMARERELEGSSMQTPPGMDSGYPPKVGGSPTGSQRSAGSHKSKDSDRAGVRSISAPPSQRSALSAAGEMAMNGSIPVGALEWGPGMPTGGARITDVIRSRTNRWKPQKSELFTTMPPNRFSSTIFPDTRHITEPSVPLSGAYLADSERFKTTNATMSIFSVPDYRTPQQADNLRKNAQNEFRVERIRQRQREFTERCHVANEASREFEEKKIARKAMNQLNYERRVRMACT